MNIILKDKIKVDNDFINELISRSWEDCESIKNQINSLDTNSTKAVEVVTLLDELLTSYYVFIGRLENINFEQNVIPELRVSQVPAAPVNSISKIDVMEEPYRNTSVVDCSTNEEPCSADTVEPFEYFVDFDDPIGEPLTDTDLYD